MSGLGWRQRSVRRGCLAALLAASGSAYADDDQVRWRVSDQGDSALLVIADSDATDHFGSPVLDCRKGSGVATAEGDAADDLRSTMAAIILHDEEPAISMVPDDPSVQIVDIVYNGMTGWRYRFQLSVTGPGFEQLARTGVFQFKVGDSLVRSEFKVALGNVRRFQDLCKRPST